MEINHVVSKILAKKYLLGANRLLNFPSSKPEVYPVPLEVSKRESFATTVNGKKPLTIIAKLSILDDCGTSGLHLSNHLSSHVFSFLSHLYTASKTKLILD